MPLIEIKSRFGRVLHSLEGDSLKTALEFLVRQGADLCEAYLCEADLRGTNLGDLSCLTELSDAIDLAPMIWQEWETNGINQAKERFGLYQVADEKRALIAMCPWLQGGYAFILPRREIWWWSWECPNPETVPVLWRENP